MDLMLVGHLALDQVVSQGQENRRVGSAVYFGAHAARASGVSCLVLTKLAPADADVLARFEQAGIEVRWTGSRHTTGIRNIYTTADQDRRTCVLIHAGDPFELAEIPADVAPRVIHVGPLLAGQVSSEVVLALAELAPLGLDAQGFTRVERAGELRNSPWPEAAQLLPRVTYFKADAAEAEVLTGHNDLDRAAHALAELGPPEVVLTHASGVRVLAGGALSFAPFTARSLQGRTGRGDTCMASYLAARIQGRDPAWAGRWAAYFTSSQCARLGTEPIAL